MCEVSSSDDMIRLSSWLAADLMPESEPSVIGKKARRARFAIHQGKLVGFADDDKTDGVTQRDVLRFAASSHPRSALQSSRPFQPSHKTTSNVCQLVYPCCVGAA